MAIAHLCLKGNGGRLWSSVLTTTLSYRAILNVRPFLNICTTCFRERYHHSHASTIMSSSHIILALINEPRPRTGTQETRREPATKWTRIEFANSNVRGMSLYVSVTVHRTHRTRHTDIIVIFSFPCST